jgi:hypothetical protein
MEYQATYPDAPFRSGTSGKYKLLIKNVTPRASDYDYELVDVEGKVYKATSQKHYVEGQILRCMVSFAVSHARLVVSDTVICSKQDFATPILDPPKHQPKQTTPSALQVTKTKPKDNHKVSTQQHDKPKRVVLGDPKHRKVSGTYVFKVAAVEQNDVVYTYRVEGANGQQYEANSKVLFPVGTLVDCKAKVAQTQGGFLKISVQSIKLHVSITAKSTKKYKKSNSLKHWHASTSSRDWFGGPNVGDHFHLIYTPMGNKR